MSCGIGVDALLGVRACSTKSPVYAAMCLESRSTHASELIELSSKKRSRAYPMSKTCAHDVLPDVGAEHVMG